MPEFPSQNFTGRAISQSYSRLAQTYTPSGDTYYILNGTGSVMFSFRSSSFGQELITSGQVVTSSLSASLVSTSSYAHTASFIAVVPTASFAISASYAPPIPSVSASYADTASVVLGSIASASYALSASSLIGGVESSSYALSSSNAQTASFSSTASVLVDGFISVVGETASFSAFRMTGSYTSLITNHYTMSNGDNGKLLIVNQSASVVVAISSSLPYGFSCTIYQSGSATSSLSALENTTIRNRQGHLSTAGQYAVISLLRVGSGDFILTGDTAT